jgi:hypothetical protein
MADTPQTNTAEATERKRAAAANFLPIVRGRLPLIFVHAIRFDAALNAMGNKDLATKFGTSVGKIFDIKKGRNFSYIDAAYMPTADDIAAGKAWMSQVGAQNAKGLTANGDVSLMQSTLTSYEQRGLGGGAQRPARPPKVEGSASAGSGGSKGGKKGSAGAGADLLA